nr:hypothetical protein [uncultured Oscillibacter sp.]
MPLLTDWRNEVIRQVDPEAREIALAAELITEGSLNVFAHPGNVNMDSRIVVLDLYEMGEQLRPTALVVTLEAIQNRVMENRKRGKYTWLCPHRLSISRHQPRLLIFGWLPHERPKPLLARRLLFFSGAEKPNSNLGGLLLQIIQSAC